MKKQNISFWHIHSSCEYVICFHLITLVVTYGDQYASK